LIYRCKDLIKLGLVPEEVCVCDEYDEFGNHEVYTRADLYDTDSIIVCSPVRRYLSGDKYEIPKHVYDKLKD